ncbi:hypothetical protein [Corynebacterium macclintockiae]|uniref:hypothetical protein n=1 Tax=Corynebacterium macclintockiae TaxID=2913501 RepID=UPI003EBF1792
MRKKTLLCVYCGKELAGRQTKFCCNKCKKAWQAREQRIGANTPNAKPDDAPEPEVTAPSVAKAAATEGHYETLAALRQKLAVEIDLATTARDLATLSARLLDTMDRISSLEAAQDKKKAGGALDELTRRRQERSGRSATA